MWRPVVGYGTNCQFPAFKPSGYQAAYIITNIIIFEGVRHGANHYEVCVLVGCPVSHVISDMVYVLLLA